MDCGAVARRRRRWASDEPALGVPSSHLLTCFGRRLGYVGFASGGVRVADSGCQPAIFPAATLVLVVLAAVVMDCGAVARRRRRWASDEPALGIPTSHLLTCFRQRLGSVGFAGGRRAGG
ncbi:hypothetical protein Dimus_008420 [Dionaea muscipula]